MLRSTGQTKYKSIKSTHDIPLTTTTTSTSQTVPLSPSLPPSLSLNLSLSLFLSFSLSLFLSLPLSLPTIISFHLHAIYLLYICQSLSPFIVKLKQGTVKHLFRPCRDSP